jgi:diguanylate cyclase (GGDEF)-like protein
MSDVESQIDADKLGRRLVESAPKESISGYKLRVLHENARDGGFALVMASVSFAVLLVSYIEISQVVPWLLATLGIITARFTAVSRFFSDYAANKALPYKKWVGIHIALLICLGSAYGVTPLLFGVDNHLALAFANLWCAGIAFSLFLSQGIVPPIGCAFAVPALGPLLAIYLLSGEIELTLAGLGNLLLFGFLFVVVGRTRNALIDEVTHRSRYEQLVSHYKSERAKSDHLVRELSEEVERRKDAEILLRRARDAAESKSNQDHLTGLSNRRVFDKVLAREWFRGMRNQKSLSLLICDIDAFKAYNDLYGMHAGDQCLVKISTALGDHTKRAGDFVSRYGGEEFALILPDTKEIAALEIAENLRNAIYELTILHAGASDECVVTASFGVATVVPEERLRYGELVRMADNALNHAKRGGGNCVYTIEGIQNADTLQE